MHEPAANPQTARSARRQTVVGVICLGLFLAAHCIVPLVWGDLYPFTSGPMFRDAPQQYCEYHFLDSEGKKHSAAEWDHYLLFHAYDGNPVGYGVGLVPPPVLEQEFGVVHPESAVRRQIAGKHRSEEGVTRLTVVVQEVIGPKPDGSVGVVQTNRFLMP